MLRKSRDKTLCCGDSSVFEVAVPFCAATVFASSVKTKNIVIDVCGNDVCGTMGKERLEEVERQRLFVMNGNLQSTAVVVRN